MDYTKYLAHIVAFILCTTLVIAGDNSLTLHYYNEADDSVTDVAVWLFECTDSSCNELTGTLTEDLIDYDDSGTSNSVTLTLPETAEETFYVAYAFAEDTDIYLPHAYYGFSFDGGNVDAEEDLTLEKKEGCQSTIQSFSLTTNEIVEEPVAIAVEVASALEYDDSVYPWGYDTGADAMTWYQDWYSAETEITLTIYREFTVSVLGIEKSFKMNVYTTTETLHILAGETEQIEFSWTPEKAGSYRATVMTTVVDAQCASSEKDVQSRTFTIEEKDEGTEETPDFPDVNIEELTFPSFDIDPSISSCTATPNPAVTDEEIAFETTPSFWTGLLDVTYTWDFGDGEITSGEDVTHIYSAAGTYTAIVTVTDSEDSTSDTCVVSVDVTESAEEEGDEEPEEPTDDDSIEDTEETEEEIVEESEEPEAIVDAGEDDDTVTSTIPLPDELENIASRHYYVGGIALSNNGNIHAGETLEIYVRAKNIANFDKDAVSYHAIIQELGLYATSGEFSLDADNAKTMILALEIPENTMSGLYPIRITISDDNVKRVIYRDVMVIE